MSRRSISGGVCFDRLSTASKPSKLCSLGFDTACGLPFDELKAALNRQSLGGLWLCQARGREEAAFVYGLSLTHHRMILIFPPALALFLWLTDRKVFTNAGLLLKTVRDVFALPEGTARIDIGMHHPEGEGIAPYGEIISVEFDSA